MDAATRRAIIRQRLGGIAKGYTCRVRVSAKVETDIPLSREDCVKLSHFIKGVRSEGGCLVIDRTMFEDWIPGDHITYTITETRSCTREEYMKKYGGG
jgi:hypothetical protein